MKRILILAISLFAVLARADEYPLNVANEASFFRSIAIVESRSSWSAVGDKHLKYRAHGAYQIRYPAIQDVNRFYRKDVLARWGRLLTPMDMHDKDKATWTLKVYLYHWGKRYQRITGKAPTASVYARIHHGGPDGWRVRATLAYWHRVRATYV